MPEEDALIGGAAALGDLRCECRVCLAVRRCRTVRVCGKKAGAKGL